MNMDVFEQWESEIRGYCRANPTVFASASGVHMVAEDGKRYIDFFSGAGVLNFGHNNPHMKKAMIEFLENDGMAHSLDLFTTTKREFIQTFAETILKPRNMHYKMQFMGPTGTNAVEAALKLARKVTGRHTVIAFTHGFHGMTLGSLSATANSYFRNAGGVPLGNIQREPFDGDAGGGIEHIRALRCAYQDASSGFDMPAALLVEPIQAEGGVNVASKEWLHEVQTLARETGALLILDDIQAGCGRTGSYFSFDDMGLDPDIITLAKGLGGYGTPIAMNLNKPEHDRHWQPGEHTGTFRGQGLSFVAGKVAMDYFKDESLMSEVREKGAETDERLRALAARFPDHDIEVRGRGMMHGLDLRDGPLAKQVAKYCFEHGLIIGPCGPAGRVIKIIAPLIISKEDLSAGLDILEAGVTQAMETVSR